MSKRTSHLNLARHKRQILLVGALLLVAVFVSLQLTSLKAQEVPKTKPRTMRVTTVDTNGKPLADTKIHAGIWTKEPFKANRDYVTDEHGAADVELPASLSILRLWAVRKGSIPLFAHWEQGEHEEGGLIPGIYQFNLRKGSVIGGIVKNAAGEPVAGATVEVMLVDSEDITGGRKQVQYSTWLAEGKDAVVTNEKGRWTLNNAPAEETMAFRVRVSHSDYISDPAWGAYQRAQGVDTAEFRKQTATIMLPKGHTVSGRVTDPDGRPVAGALAIWGDDPYSQWGSQEVPTDADGAYKLPPQPAGPLRVTVVAEGWMPQTSSITAELPPPHADFQLSRGKTLKLRIVDDKGAAVAKAYIGIAGWQGAKSLYNHKHPNVLDSKIPRQASDMGIYEWTWAPDDAVEYSVGQEGFISQKVSLTADGKEHKLTLSRSPIFPKTDAR